MTWGVLVGFKKFSKKRVKALDLFEFFKEKNKYEKAYYYLAEFNLIRVLNRRVAKIT
jgi:hypothetical protein